MLEIICVSLIGASVYHSYCLASVHLKFQEFIQEKKSLLIFSLEHHMGEKTDFLLYVRSGWVLSCPALQDIVNPPVVKSRLGHSRKWTCQRPAEDPQSLPDDGWKGGLSLPGFVAQELHETAGYL